MHQASSADRAGLMRRSQDHGCSLAMSTATMSVTWPGRPGGPHSGPAPHIPPPAWRGSSVRNSISASRVVPKPRPTSSRGSRIEAIDLATTGDQNQSQQQRLVEGAFPGAPALAHHPVWRVSTVRASSARRSAPRDAGQGAPPGAQFSPPAPGILPAREGAASQPRGFKVRPRTSVAAPRPRGGDFLVVEGGGRGRRRADGEDSGRSLGGGWGCNAASQRTTTTATTTTTTKPEEEDSNGVVVTSARPPQEVAVRFRPFSSRDLGPGPKWGITDLTLQANNLVAVPHAVSQLRGLVKLTITWNSLASLPTWISQLRGLRELDASFNQILHVPREISLLSSLEALRLNDNNLQRLPPALGLMPCLTTLHVRFNNITERPLWVGRGAGGLISVDMRGNPCHAELRGGGGDEEGDEECVARLVAAYDCSLLPMLEAAMADL